MTPPKSGTNPSGHLHGCLRKANRQRWYRPADLYASYNKSWFESQAKFLDVPFAAQRRALLEYLGINLSPKPFQVIRHLLKCAEDDVDPPRGIYQWLNENASAADLQDLRERACLRLGGRYVRPDQVFWGQHPFGRFRVALGPDLQQYSRLLSALGIKTHPEHGDALNVLKDVSRDVGNAPLTPNDQAVVGHCWVTLSDALRDSLVSEPHLFKELATLKCIPNRQNLLSQPTWMFFEDRPGLAEKFSLAVTNTITKPEGAWQAMAAAGVRPISLAVQGELLEVVNPREDTGLQAAVAHRSLLIRRIVESNNSDAPATDVRIPLENLRFFRADDLKLVWHLSAFDRKQTTTPESTTAYLDRGNTTIYFAIQNRGGPWPALARELAQAVAPGAGVATVSLALMAVLEATDDAEAELQLDIVGMARIQSPLSMQSLNGSVVQAFTERGDGVDPEGAEAKSQSAEANDNEANTEPANGQVPLEMATEPMPFGQKLFEMQAVALTPAAPHYEMFPESGPRTEQSSKEDTRLSAEFGRQGAPRQRSIVRWTPTRTAQDLAERFEAMVHADYGKRCQICSRTFKTHSGEPQVFVISIVPPGADSRTNHFGNLVGVCAWHAELLRHGQWRWLDGDSQPIRNWQSFIDIILNAEEREEDSGRFKSIAMRFFNVYVQGAPDPVTVDEHIRYSFPHWEYLRSLLTVEEDD